MSEARRGHVVAVHLHVEHEMPMREVEFLRAVPGYGLMGDLHAGRDRRQVLILERETLDALGLRPGDLREQITVDLPGMTSVAPGTSIRVGEAMLEAVGPCDPCTHIGRLLAKPDADAFRDTLQGRRGLLARVVEVEDEGLIRPGDRIELPAPG